MSYFVNVRSDDNPLEVYTGNDGLQVTQRHKWSAGYTWNNALRHRLLAVTADYQLFHNAVAMGYDYNRETGVKTFRPENVNGNSSATARVNFSTPLDRKQQLTLDLNTDASYYHSADLRSDATEMTTKKSFVKQYSAERFISFRPFCIRFDIEQPFIHKVQSVFLHRFQRAPSRVFVHHA